MIQIIRYIPVIAIVCGALAIPMSASAQNDVPVYNSYGQTSSSVKPLSLKQILNGQDNAAASGSTTTNVYSRSTGATHSLALSPEQIRANRERMNQRAEEEQRALARARQNESSRSGSGNSFAPRNNSMYTTVRSSDFERQNAGSDQQPRRRVYRYDRRSSGFEMPQRVFNSVE